MLPILLLTTIAGFSYEKVVLSDRAKAVSSAPEGERAIWKEHIETLVATDRRDAAFSRYVREQALALAQDYYGGETGEAKGSFETNEVAGSLDVSEEVVAASPDIVSVRGGLGYFEAGMAHPNSDFELNLVWSRKLGRPLRQADVFARPPDRALRRRALMAFSNRAGISDPLPDGLPLDWARATIGPDGITWLFGPYELGGYLSGGDATLGWAVLKPYLRRGLPFAPAAIRAPGQGGN